MSSLIDGAHINALRAQGKPILFNATRVILDSPPVDALNREVQARLKERG